MSRLGGITYGRTTEGVSSQLWFSTTLATAVNNRDRHGTPKATVR